jgi:arsenate reductase
MAEAFFNKHSVGLEIEAISAGFEPGMEIPEKIVKLMREKGMDISQKKPKPITRELVEEAQSVIIVCEMPADCPRYVREKVKAVWAIRDGAHDSTDEDLRSIRDDVETHVKKLVGQKASSSTRLP